MTAEKRAPRSDLGRPTWRGYPTGVTEQPTVPLEQQLKEIGAQLDWVRDYL